MMGTRKKQEIAWKREHEVRFPLLNSFLKTKKGKRIDFNYIYSNIFQVFTLFVQK